MGQTMSVGTGAFRIVRELNLQEGEVGKKATVFEDVWAWDERERKKAVRNMA